MSKFILHPQLEKDSLFVAKYKSLQIRLVKDNRFFWLLLIPERNDICEWHELKTTEQQDITNLTNFFSNALKVIEKADKINIGALGNMVSQFHFHILARHIGDAAWPSPVWGNTAGKKEDTRLLDARMEKILQVVEKL
ncbi:MAG: HIT family protein [Alphaproteobacteria bacterium]|nr:HIT family protein [Alphaproteobacteria bacterium]MBL6776943.1 HIT family protein [Alphaproteobacteria bacterium]